MKTKRDRASVFLQLIAYRERGRFRVVGLSCSVRNLRSLLLLQKAAEVAAPEFSLGCRRPATGTQS